MKERNFFKKEKMQMKNREEGKDREHETSG